MVDEFAHRVLLANRRGSVESGAAAFDVLLAELRAQPDHGLALLSALADHTSERVRDWSAAVARSELGHDGLPVLLKLAKHRRLFTRDGAMQELAALDPELLRPFIPEMRRILRRSTTLHSEGGATMWRLVLLRDRDSGATLRAFAAKHDHRYYDYRMPMVLADFLEDANSIGRRIAEHDHDWMLWLVMAARQVGVPNAAEILDAGSKGLPDEACRNLCQKELSAIRSLVTTTLGSSDIQQR